MVSERAGKVHSVDGAAASIPKLLFVLPHVKIICFLSKERMKSENDQFL